MSNSWEIWGGDTIAGEVVKAWEVVTPLKMRPKTWSKAPQMMQEGWVIQVPNTEQPLIACWRQLPATRTAALQKASYHSDFTLSTAYL